MSVDGNEKNLTELLVAWADGDSQALEQIAPIIYNELHRLAQIYVRQERRSALQTTELVHEAYLKLVGSDVSWLGRGHFYVVAARQMRRILVDMSRKRAAIKRGGLEQKITFAEGSITVERPSDMVALDEALEELSSFDDRKCRVIELSYFFGLTIPQIAQSLDLSTATVERDLRTARAWLAKTLKRSATGQETAQVTRAGVTGAGVTR